MNRRDIDFAIFGKQGSGLRTLASALGGHSKLTVNTDGLDGIKNSRTYGDGEVRGTVIEYKRSHMLFTALPPRVIHLTRIPYNNAREMLAIQSSTEPKEWEINATSKRILFQQMEYRRKLDKRKGVEIHEVCFEDLDPLNRSINEALTDFLFVHFQILKVRRLKDEW